jgi:DNA-binding NtrC family response regulator
MRNEKALCATTIDARTAVLVSADDSFRQHLAENLTGMRWTVRQASGGAEALCYLEEAQSEALLLDSWLPDLEAEELAAQIRMQYPALDLICIDETESPLRSAKSARRNELLHALRCAQDASPRTAARMRASEKQFCGSIRRGMQSPEAHGISLAGSFLVPKGKAPQSGMPLEESGGRLLEGEAANPQPRLHAAAAPVQSGGQGNPMFGKIPVGPTVDLPGLIGGSAEMQRLAHSIRLLAPRRTTVLIEGPTGSGKELVARALHRLSPRSNRPLVVLNCAAIPEPLLEAELFGHTRGAFTGATQARVGRMEAANGGTLFLDEIGEMPLALQAKVLRFLEAGEVQRIGENEPARVDVRVVAATHQPLMQRVEEGRFRADLYFRLAVFPLHTPALSARPEDIPGLALHFLEQLCENSPAKRLAPEAVARLMSHAWPGNVRELAHVIERAYILAEDRPCIRPDDIYFT